MLVDYGFNSSTVVSFLVFFFFFLIEWARLRQFFFREKRLRQFHRQRRERSFPGSMQTWSTAGSSVLTTNSLSKLPTLKMYTVYYILGSSLPSITFTHSDFSQDTAEKKNKGCFFLNLNEISSIHRRKKASHSGTSIDASVSQGKNSYNKLQNYIMYQ